MCYYDNLRQLNRQLLTILGLFFITKIRSAMLATKIFKNQWYILFFAHKNADCIGERKNKTLYIITCLRFHRASSSRHTGRMFCTWFVWWSQLGLMANDLDLSYGREWLRIFGWTGHAMLVLMRKLEWCGRYVRMCTCGRNACGSCSKCGTFWRFCPKGDRLGLRKQLVP